MLAQQRILQALTESYQATLETGPSLVTDSWCGTARAQQQFWIFHGLAQASPRCEEQCWVLPVHRGLAKCFCRIISIDGAVGCVLVTAVLSYLAFHS